MNNSPFRINAKTMILVAATIAFVIAAISGLQPVLDVVFGAGTLFAPKATAEDRIPSTGEGIASGNAASEGDLLRLSGDRPRDIFRNDPLSRLVLELENKRIELDEREEALREEEVRLNVLRGEIDRKLSEMETLRASLSELAVQGDKDLKKWIAIYQAMQPAEAAQVLAGLDDSLARRTLSGMEPAKAGKILDVMDKQRAIQLGAGLQRALR